MDNDPAKDLPRALLLTAYSTASKFNQIPVFYGAKFVA